MIARGKEPVAVLSPYRKKAPIKLGMFNGKYTIPDDIDEYNDEILKMMEGQL